METFSALLAICAGNSPVPGEFHAQRPVTQSFDVFFDLCPNKRLSKQWWGWWFETVSSPLWRHCNAHPSLSPTFHFRHILTHFILSIPPFITSTLPIPFTPTIISVTPFLNYRWLIIKWTFRNKRHCILNQNTDFFSFNKVHLKMSAK